MKIWRFRDPSDPRFAAGGRRGTWVAKSDDPGGQEGTCPVCTATRLRRAKPLLLAWEPGPGEIGDVIWPSLGELVLATERSQQLLGRFVGFEPGPVEIVDDPDYRGQLPAERPATGEGLQEVWITARVSLDRQRSSVELEHRCSACGTERWLLYGAEEWDSHWDQELKQLVRVKTPRLPGSGVYLPEPELGRAGVFRVDEFPAWMFCTDDVRQAVEEAGLTNLSFLEMGETF